jgi:hypothetical protein
MAPSLKQRVRKSFVTGDLWPLPSQNVWASVGDGTEWCAVCLERITGVSYELTSPAGAEVVVHYACYLLWRQESAVLAELDESASRDEGAEDTWGFHDAKR